MPGRSVTIKVSEGGALSASLSNENVGASNYIQKTNWRRDKDQERRREGWVKFEPNVAHPANQWEFDGADTVIRLAELVRPNGERCVVGASRTKIKRFNYTTGVWDTIGSGFSSQGKRWQVATMDGYIVFNNAVDLPVSYRVESASVTPLYELREVGVASAGRMEQNSGFILFADIVEIQGDQLIPWMNGYSTYTQSSSAKAANFTIVSPADSGKRFDVTTGASTITATLPASPSLGFYFWIKKVDNGAGQVVTSPLIGSQVPVLTTQNNLVLVRWDMVNQAWSATNFSTGSVPSDAPYGLVPASITNRYPWRVINGEFSNPINWAPVFSVYMTAASATITLPFPSHAFTAGSTRVGVINGGPSGGILGGQSATPNGVLVTAVSGSTITLEVSTDTVVTYPRVVQVVRWSDTSSLTSSYDLQDDSSLIIGMLTLQNLVIVYRRTGVYVGRYTGLTLDENGNQTGPFTWRPRYSGFNIPKWGDAIANVNGEYHLYPAEGGRFYAFDGNTNPVIHPQTDMARGIFFSGMLDSDEPYVVENALTKEWWFCRPSLVFAYDFEWDTVGIIDAQIDAACFCQRPESLDRWFVIGLTRFVYTYGLVDGVVPIHTWLRDGQPSVPVIKSGLIDGKDPFNEKVLFSFVPILASQSPDMQSEVQLYGCWNPSVPPVALLSPAQTLPTPEDENLVACFFQYLYFQYMLTVTDSRDLDVRLSAFIFEFDKVAAGRVTTRIGQ
jgi:hypothetical protein